MSGRESGRREEGENRHRRKKSSTRGEERQPDPGGQQYGQQYFQARQHGSGKTGDGRQQQNAGQNSSGFKSGHMEVNSLYSGESGSIQVNSMNAPNNSTLQCGCENIDCPFCNQMLSIQMSGN